MIEDNYNIIIDDNTEKANNKFNEIMKILAILTAIFVPFNTISGIFGLNVQLPLTNYNNFFPFFGIIFFIISLGILQIFVFKKWKWI